MLGFCVASSGRPGRSRRAGGSRSCCCTRRAGRGGSSGHFRSGRSGGSSPSRATAISRLRTAAISFVTALLDSQAILNVGYA